MYSDELRIENRQRATRWLTEVVFGASFAAVAEGLDELSFWLLVTGVEADDPLTLALALGLPLPRLTLTRQRRRA